MTGTTEPAHVEPAWSTLHYGGDEWHEDLAIRVYVRDVAVVVTVECLPGARWWRQPHARYLRRIVDNALAGTGRRRDGIRTRHFVSNGWTFAYLTTPVDDA